MTFVQGNTYRLPILLKINGEIITDKDVKKVEFIFDDVKKYYPQDVTFDGQHFICNLSQKDTFSFATIGFPKYQARVLFNDDVVKGTNSIEFEVVGAQSKEVLK